MINEIIKYVVMFVITVMSGAITTVVLPALSGWLKSKTNSEMIRSAIDELAQTTGTTVDYIEQTVVSEMKQENNWNADTQKEVLQLAVSTVLSGLTDATKKTMESGNAYETVKRYIEAYIQSKKTA